MKDQHPHSIKPNRGRHLWLLAKVAVLVLGALMIWLMFRAIHELNRAPYAGFEMENRPLLMVRQAVGDLLAEGDIIISVDGHRVAGALDWEILQRRLPARSTLEITVRRQGQIFPVRMTLAKLQTARLALGPESLLLMIESAGADLPFDPGNRILSVDGLQATEANLARIGRLLTGEKDSVMLIVLTKGRIKLAAASKEQLRQLRTRVVARYPVFLTSVHRAAPPDLQSGMQLVVVNGQPVINRDQVEAQLAELGFGADLILNLKTAEEYQSILFTISLNRWEQAFPAPLFHLIYALASFALLAFLILRYPRPGMAVLHGLFFVGMMGAVLSGWSRFYPPLAGMLSWSWPALVLLPLLTYLLLTETPIRLEFLRGQQRFLQVGAAFAVIWAAALLLSRLGWPPGWLPGAISTLLALTLTSLLLVCSFWTLKKTRQSYERGPFTIHLLGLIPGVWMPLLGLTIEAVSPDCRLCWPTALMVLAGVNLPLALCYDFWRRRVQYTDVLLKKTLAFLVASGVIVLLYFSAVVWSGTAIHKFLRVPPLWIVLVVLLLSAFLFHPLHALFLQVLDRLFYRNQLGYRAYILQASRELNYVMEISRIVDLTLNKICQVAYLQGGYFFLRKAEGRNLECVAARTEANGALPEEVIADDFRLLGWLRERQEPIELAEANNYRYYRTLPPEEIQILERLDVSVLAPLISRQEIIGLFLLQGKLSGDLFTSEDLDFLGILCNQTAIALDNAMYHEKEKAMVSTIHHQKRLALIGQMAANIAHEIRNPLVAVKGLGQLVAESFEPEDRRRQHMQILNSEVNRLQNVVSELVRFARPSALRLEEADLTECARAGLALYEEEFRKHGIDASLTSPPEPVMVRADTEKLRQVVINLFQNAMEALDGGGQIQVETGLEKQTVMGAASSYRAVLRIADSGPGIDPALREKVFEPFYSGRQSGSGLGLAIARGIMEDHEGSISITDSPLGGACFELRLPSAQVSTGDTSS